MNADATQPPEIRPIPPEQYRQALALLLDRLAEVDRQRQVAMAVAAGQIDRGAMPGLLGAYRGQEMAGVGLAQIQAGRAATVWPPRLVVGEPAATATRLLDELCRFLAAGDVRVAQTLLESDAAADERTLCAGGFRRLAELFYLVSQESEFPTSPPLSPLEFEPYSPSNHGRLARIVEATYGQTRDCPGLNGVRDVEDVLAGYRASGVFDAGRWLLVRHGGADVGCLLLSDFPEHDNWELCYMGVAPRARGNGWGAHIVRYAQWRARLAGRLRLVLAVDATNGPALKLYAAAGFQAWAGRTVYVKVFGQGHFWAL